MRTAQHIADSINANDGTIFATAGEVQACIDSVDSLAAAGNPIAAIFAGDEPTRVEVLARRRRAEEEAANKSYKITGTFKNGAEGRNIWDYLNSDAEFQLFNSPEAAIIAAQIMSKGPDADGVEPVWGAVEVVRA